MDRVAINNYLYYGYHFVPEDLSWVCDPVVTPGMTNEYIPEQAGLILDSTLDRVLADVSGKGDCVIPLSGGWDSRILLGAALERFETKQIRTLSFGVPGQLDYDIGSSIARKLRLRHVGVDLSQVPVSWDSLLKSVKRAPLTYAFDAFYNQHSVAQAATEGDVILSGFMGDPLTGGHFSNTEGYQEALARFVKKQRRARSKWLPSSDYDPAAMLPGDMPASRVSFSEMLDLGVRQSNCIAGVVTPLTKWNKWEACLGVHGRSGADFIAPFIHADWAGYWLRAPASAKFKQNLYLAMMRLKYPRLAELPSKSSLGTAKGNRLAYSIRLAVSKARSQAHKLMPCVPGDVAQLNYLDFDRAFATRQDFKDCLERAVAVLTQADATPWLDLEKIVRDQQMGKSDNSDAFLVLIGLALNIAAQEE